MYDARRGHAAFIRMSIPRRVAQISLTKSSELTQSASVRAFKVRIIQRNPLLRPCGSELTPLTIPLLVFNGFYKVLGPAKLLRSSAYGLG